tara:strand:+ start:113 stop:433 length:321 start_codon:yes stop_codon:yes gene_type:complete
MTIKFFKKSIKKDNIKAGVEYLQSKSANGLEKITIYETSSYGNLAKIFPTYEDIIAKNKAHDEGRMMDYGDGIYGFCSRINIFSDSPLFNDLKSALNNAGKKYKIL